MRCTPSPQADLGSGVTDPFGPGERRRYPTEMLSMTYRGTQQESRERDLASYDADEASKCDSWTKAMTSADHDACVTDMRRCVTFRKDMEVLDAGSGTGTLCLALVRIPGLRITALEPCTTMSDLLKLKPELEKLEVAIVRGLL